MKAIFLALFVVAVSASPLPDSGSDAVEMVVNGVPDGAALEIGDIVDIKLKEHADGAVVASNLLHPYTAVGIAEAAAAAVSSDGSVVDNNMEHHLYPMPIVIPSIPSVPDVVLPAPIVMPSPAVPEVVVPEPVVMPSPAVPEVVVPEPIVMPSPAVPEVVVPEPIVMPSPAVPEVVVPEPIVMPSPAVPEVVIPEPVVMPSPAIPEVVISPEEMPVVAPQFSGDLYNDGLVQVQYNGPELSLLSTLHSWFSLVVNYFNGSPEARH